jgi:hypothetical protein
MAQYKGQATPELIDGALVERLTGKYGPVRAFVLNYARGDAAANNPWILWYGASNGYTLPGKLSLWKDHDAYQKAFQRLLRDLKADSCQTPAMEGLHMPSKPKQTTFDLRYTQDSYRD